MDQEIKESIRRLFLKFLLLQAMIFVAAISASVLLSAHFKERIAMQLSGAARDSLLSGDSRAVISSLTAPMARDFYGMVWVPAEEGAAGFAIPAHIKGHNELVYAAVSVTVYFDEDRRLPAGKMSFFYPRWTPVLWALFGWAVIFGLSVPVALYERRRLIADYTLLLRLRIKETYSTLAAQVAHDIRSPLAALGEVTKAAGLSEEHRALARSSLARINGIAEDMLERYRSPGAAASEAARPQDIPGLIGPVVSEKKLQYKAKTGIKIEVIVQAGAAVAAVVPKEFQRIVSNLINNSLEALPEEGAVTVRLYRLKKRVFIEVRDNGKGIPGETLAKLGQKGETHGKQNGTGLGLYHAKNSVEGWGGGLDIKSEVGKGTTVTIHLPEVTVPVASSAVLLDDDPLAHMNWKMAAKRAGVELRAFTSPDEFASAMEKAPKTTAIYRDSELGNGVKGEEIAAAMHEKGFSDISMATGHSADKFSNSSWLKIQGKEPPW